jgi:hypothetical protein
MWFPTLSFQANILKHIEFDDVLYVHNFTQNKHCSKDLTSKEHAIHTSIIAHKCSNTNY